MVVALERRRGLFAGGNRSCASGGLLRYELTSVPVAINSAPRGCEPAILRAIVRYLRAFLKWMAP